MKISVSKGNVYFMRIASFWERIVIGIIFLMIGGTCFFIGAFLLIDSLPVNEFFFMGVGLVFAGTGFLFICAGFLAILGRIDVGVGS